MAQEIIFKLHTIINNSELTEIQKDALKKHAGLLSEGKINILVTLFEKYKKAPLVYADYVLELQSQPAPLSPEKLEELLTRTMEKMSSE